MMKSVHIRYFAAFRDAAGLAEERTESSAQTLRELFRECAERHDALFPEQAALVAVNDEMKNWGDGFEADDEVLFFPPVAGG